MDIFQFGPVHEVGFSVNIFYLNVIRRIRISHHMSVIYYKELVYARDSAYMSFLENQIIII